MTTDERPVAFMIADVAGRQRPVEHVAMAVIGPAQHDCAVAQITKEQSVLRRSCFSSLDGSAFARISLAPTRASAPKRSPLWFRAGARFHGETLTSDLATSTLSLPIACEHAVSRSDRPGEDAWPVTDSELPPAVLRDAIAESLSSISAHDVAHACDSFGLPEVHDGSDPWNSKYKYVRKRLFGVRQPELVAIAGRIIDEYDDHTLIALVRSDGLRGVDGELKNLIFAANGPKPRIVLRDAINNVIEIVDHAGSCLVYDRPLRAHGLSWGDLVGWWSEMTGDETDPSHDLYRRLRLRAGR